MGDEGRVKAPQNFIDRAIAVFDPERAVRRIQNRMRLSALGAWNGASTTSRNLAGWATSRGDSDRDLAPSLSKLRERSRDLIRNNPIAGGAVGSTVTSVVGTGFTLQSQIDACFLGLEPDEAAEWQRTAEREWSLLADSTNIDITRTQNFAGLCDLVFRSTLESGDCFSLLTFKPWSGSIYDTRVQVIEADRVCNKDLTANGPNRSMGVVLDDAGAPVAYDILKSHPGGYASGGRFEWDTIPAFGTKTGRRNVLHHFRRVRPGQNRGIPFLAPVIEKLKQLDRYSDAEITAAVISGFFSVFITSDGGSGIPAGTLDGAGGTPTDKDLKLQAGLIADLAPGEKIEVANPGRPNANFDPFVLAILRQIGIGLEIPYEVLIRHFQSSFSAARAAIAEAWKFYRARRAWLISSFCQPVYEAFLEEAISRGRISAPGFFDDPAIRKAYCGASWMGDAMTQIDPTREIAAAKGRVELGISDRRTEAAALCGTDWETTHVQQVREAEARREGGLDPNVTATPKAGVQDATDGGDDPEEMGGDGSESGESGDGQNGKGKGQR